MNKSCILIKLPGWGGGGELPGWLRCHSNTSLCSSDHFNGRLFANVAFNENFFVYSRAGEMWEISTVAWIMEMTIICKNYANIFCFFVCKLSKFLFVFTFFSVVLVVTNEPPPVL